MIDELPLLVSERLFLGLFLSISIRARLFHRQFDLINDLQDLIHREVRVSRDLLLSFLCKEEPGEFSMLLAADLLVLDLQWTWGQSR